MKAVRLARDTWDVLLLADDQGRCEVMEVLQQMERHGGAGMLALLRDRVAKVGPPRGNTALCKPVADEVWEFRKGSVRVFWFYDQGRVVVGALAYKKQGQKAPGRHIETAQRLRSEYLAAKRAGTLAIGEFQQREER